MSDRIRYVPEKYLHEVHKACHYALSKGNKPNDEAVCTNQKRSHEPFNSGFTNEHVLKKFVPVPRVQSRFRVSPSPRKIDYTQPFEMVRNF